MQFRNPFKNAKVIGEGIDYAVYSRQTAKRGEQDFIMSSGQLKTFMTCPKKWRAGFESGDSPSKDYGNLIDCLALTPKKFGDRFVLRPETYPDSKTGAPKPWNNNATFCKDWNEDQGDKQIVKPSALDDAKAAITTLRENSTIAELLDCSKKQVMVVAEYHDRDTGLVIPVRILLDLVPDKSNPRFGQCLADFKTSRSACPYFWVKQVFKMGYDLQAALYRDVYAAATNEDRTSWAFVVQESEFPWVPAYPLPMLSTEYLEIGQNKYLFALRYYARCLSENKWPGYAPMPTVLDVFQIIQEEDWMVGKMNEWPILSEARQPTEPQDETAEITP